MSKTATAGVGRETLTRNRASDYFTIEGLRTSTGLLEHQWDYAIVKELTDNALDAVNNLDYKEVSVEFDCRFLRVCDNGEGITHDTLEKIYNFDVYVSSKHYYRTPTRGMQGNALKTIIGICAVRSYDLSFASGSKMYHYKLNRDLYEADILDFNRIVNDLDSDSAIDGTCVTVDYHDTFDCQPPYTLTDSMIHELIWSLHLANPDVTFRFNDTVYEAVTSSKKYTEKIYIHCYDFDAFYKLLQAVVINDENRTVKDFCLTFSGTQRILSKLEFPYKKLSDFNTDKDAVRSLLRELKAKVKSLGADTYKNMLTGETAFMDMFRAKSDSYSAGCELECDSDSDRGYV